ncbi:MAG: prepilin-type N-terminal cleavage/methylation domain-containing protein [Actinobacteria bacterium]|nr:MAG: prepilin-type N-terminal cleavage/methylation domain-containing protein [Actinomycetota bacterium]
MFNSLRQRSKDEGGFTLIELLVVILIIGILAAIAIPSFLNQKGKAQDSSAKTQAASAQTAMETYATDHNGSYEGASVAELQAIEPTLKDKTTAELETAKGKGSEEYEVTSKAVGSGNKFTIKMTAGEVARSCTTEKKGGCPAGGKW